MGNSVEDRRESDEVARAAYALDRMSASEIARIISGDKRGAVMRALAEQFSGEQMAQVNLPMPSVKVVASIMKHYPIRQQLKYPDFGPHHDQITPLKRPKTIPFSSIDHIAEYMSYRKESYQSFVDKKDWANRREGPTIVVTKTGFSYKTEEKLVDIFRRVLHGDNNIELSYKNWSLPQEGSYSRFFEILIPRI